MGCIGARLREVVQPCLHFLRGSTTILMAVLGLLKPGASTTVLMPDGDVGTLKLQLVYNSNVDSGGGWC